MKPKKTLIVLGSGGHTAEMLSFLKTLDESYFFPRCYVVANTDVGVNGGENKAKLFESEFGSSRDDFSIKKIYRSREVGQSYITSLFSTIIAFFSAFSIIWSEMPDLILCNGPGTCVPICIVAFIFRIFGLKQITLVFSESFACVSHLSLSGKILYYLVDQFFVQWKGLTYHYPKAKYVGRIDGVDTPPLIEDTQTFTGGSVLVTVGSTKFDGLIEFMDKPEIHQTLKKLGFTGLRLQIGRGTYIPSNIEDISDFRIEYFKFTDNLKEEIESASLVVSHAGAGSILETLSLKKPLLVVPNEILMNNHQIQLGKQMAEAGYLLFSRLENLNAETLFNLFQSSNLKSLKTFPSSESPRFKEYLYQELDIPRT